VSLLVRRSSRHWLLASGNADLRFDLTTLRVWAARPSAKERSEQAPDEHTGGGATVSATKHAVLCSGGSGEGESLDVTPTVSDTPPPRCSRHPPPHRSSGATPACGAAVGRARPATGTVRVAARASCRSESPPFPGASSSTTTMGHGASRDPSRGVLTAARLAGRGVLTASPRSPRQTCRSSCGASRTSGSKSRSAPR